MALSISRGLWIGGRPVDFGVGRCGSMQVHSASERSVRYALLMLGRVPSQCLRIPFRTVSRRGVLGSSPVKSSRNFILCGSLRRSPRCFILRALCCSAFAATLADAYDTRKEVIG